MNITVYNLLTLCCCHILTLEINTSGKGVMGISKCVAFNKNLCASISVVEELIIHDIETEKSKLKLTLLV